MVKNGWKKVKSGQKRSKWWKISQIVVKMMKTGWESVTNWLQKGKNGESWSIMNRKRVKKGSKLVKNGRKMVKIGHKFIETGWKLVKNGQEWLKIGKNRWYLYKMDENSEWFIGKWSKTLENWLKKTQSCFHHFGPLFNQFSPISNIFWHFSQTKETRNEKEGPLHCPCVNPNPWSADPASRVLTWRIDRRCHVFASLSPPPLSLEASFVPSDLNTEYFLSPTSLHKDTRNFLMNCYELRKFSFKDMKMLSHGCNGLAWYLFDQFPPVLTYFRRDHSWPTVDQFSLFFTTFQPIFDDFLLTNIVYQIWSFWSTFWSICNHSHLLFDHIVNSLWPTFNHFLPFLNNFQQVSTTFQSCNWLWPFSPIFQ
jgi:hypothetical protein